MEKILLISIISSQKLYFGDDDAIYDVIIQEPFENDVITTDMKSAGIITLPQIDRANFAVRGPSSLGAK